MSLCITMSIKSIKSHGIQLRDDLARATGNREIEADVESLKKG
jgi:hypothetical protein